MSSEAIPHVSIPTIYARLVALAGPSRATLASLAGLTIASALLAVAVPWPFQLLVDYVLGLM